MNVLGGFYHFLSAIKNTFWPTNESLKRNRRDSFEEEEEDDSISSYRFVSKKPKWSFSKQASPYNMATDGFKSAPTSKTSRSDKLHSKKGLKNCHPKGEEKSKTDPEVVIIEDDDSEQLRSPLSALTIRTRHKTSTNSHVHSSCNGVRRVSSSCSDKVQNGLHQNAFQSIASSQLRISRPSSNHRVTALNEAFDMDERNTYSKILCSWQRPTARQTTETSGKWPLMSSLGAERKLPTSFSTDIIDLTKEEQKPQRLTISAKPYHSPDTSEDDVKVLDVRFPVPQVNSLAKRLANIEHVSPEWINEIKKKYGEKERERLRQLKEEHMKRDLSADYNSAKLHECLQERIRRHMKITDVVLDDTEEVPVLPELTLEMRMKIKAAFKPNPASEVLVEAFGQQIKRCDIQTLYNLNWLNDEVINFYMNLIIERGKLDNYMSVYAFNTFFYPKLVSHGYSSLRRWTKKVDIFSHKMILVPVHLGVHWCMAVIDFRDRSVRYYDSMGSENNRCLNALRQYLVEESLDKKKVPYDVSGWKLENVKDIPQQMNGSDCGMFSCMFGEYLSRNATISFTQKEMPYFRQKMAFEIISRRLLM